MVGVRNGVGARRTLTYGGEGNVAVVHSFVECQYYICLIAPINYQRRTNQEEGELRSHDYGHMTTIRFERCPADGNHIY